VCVRARACVSVGVCVRACVRACVCVRARVCVPSVVILQLKVERDVLTQARPSLRHAVVSLCPFDTMPLSPLDWTFCRCVIGVQKAKLKLRMVTPLDVTLPVRSTTALQPNILNQV
jgi:hypothetical protein